MARLVTIGDSISQGFMSAGAARTELSYSTLLARALGLQPQRDYEHPWWALGGIPFNMEVLLRKLAKHYGEDVFGPFEWAGAAVRIASFLDRLEDHYERGDGDYRRPFLRPADRQPVAGFHNLASFGFTVSDAWQLTPRACLRELEPQGDRRVDDDAFGLPSDAFYRSAFRVLNPANAPEAMDRAALDWLAHYAEADADGVENLLLWLGANNALGTVLHLDIREASMSLADYRRMDHFARGSYNLFHERLFREDYRSLLERVMTILADDAHARRQPDWRVFLATVPPVTIAPVAKGVGATTRRRDPFGVVQGGARYYEQYVYFPFGPEDAAAGRVPALSGDEAYAIDERIHAYNDIIRDLAKQQNAALGTERFHVVDMASALTRLAFKRNNGHPTYPMPRPLQQVLAARGTPINTRYYRAEGGRVVSGGVFSLDGVHPTALGQGLIAHEFLQVMKKAGVRFDADLDWERIAATDDLYSRPLDLVQELFQHDRLAAMLLRKLRTPPETVDEGRG
jgi:lysophospholipase L1-like esterase